MSHPRRFYWCSSRAAAPLAAWLALGSACSDEDTSPTSGEPSQAAGTTGVSGAPEAPVGAGGSPADPGAPPTASGTPTYYQDVGPIFGAKCVGCHREGGIAPFALDDYAAARARGVQIADYTEARIMPPFSIQTGGECGSFDESAALTPEQIALIGAWGRGERAEGTPVALTLAPAPALDGANVELSLPEFTPEVDGSEVALFDEYRCFALDPGQDALSFITGYQVVPGNAAIVHHVLGFIVDPAASARDGRTNAEVMQALHDTDPNPEREGWSCFGAAGDGVEVEGAPITWGPGLGVMSYGAGLGVPLAPGRQLVVQVHYNLADSQNIGASDQTRLLLRTVPLVERPALFLLEDPLLDSLDDEVPASLPPGEASVKYTWERTGAQLGIPAGLPTELVSLLPHMHERGRKYTFEVDNGSGYECQGQIDRWDFNWQRNYDYATPVPLTSETRLRVTCDFDTTGLNEPVLPGWGTRNEMCLATMMIALPGGI
jgi:hypothetical protein